MITYTLQCRQRFPFTTALLIWDCSSLFSSTPALRALQPLERHFSGFTHATQIQFVKAKGKRTRTPNVAKVKVIERVERKCKQLDRVTGRKAKKKEEKMIPRDQ